MDGSLHKSKGVFIQSEAVTESSVPQLCQFHIMKSSFNSTFYDMLFSISGSRGNVAFGDDQVIFVLHCQAHEELMKLQVKHAADVARLTKENQVIQEEMIRLTCLNKVPLHPVSQAGGGG